MKKTGFNLWIIIFLLATVVFVMVSHKLCFEQTGLLINILFILLMALMIFIGYFGWLFHRCGLGALIRASEDLRNGASKIEQAAADPGMDMHEVVFPDDEKSSLFKTDLLKKALMNYRNELDRLYRDNSDFRYVDVADYINQELLDTIGNTSFNNLISGSMTGLGILGTFVGLMFGLRDFNTETTEQMMQTITPLIDGIKVAFITSICGVIYSILFNVFYRVVFSNASDALDDFLKAFYKRVSPRPENDGITKLLNYQKGQSDSMSQLAENISLSMASALGESVLPTFHKIEATIDSLASKVANNQSESIGRISEEFVQKMDESMGNQMHHLGENVQALCQWQDSTMEKMKQAVDLFAESGNQLSILDAGLEKSVKSMEGYMNSVTTLQDQFTLLLMEIKEQQTTEANLVQMQKAAFNQIQQADVQLMERVESVSTQMHAASEHLSSTSDDLSNNLGKAMTQTYQEIDRQLAEIVQHLSGTIADIRDVTETVPNMLRISSEQTRKSMDDYLKMLTKSQEELLKSFNHSKNREDRGQRK